MKRFLAALFVLPLLILPVAAQPLSDDAIAKQSQAIAISVQRQLMRCWIVPEGSEGKRISIDIVFFGHGAMDGEPVIASDNQKFASKNAVLVRSIMVAISRCTPFSGLEALGAGSDERFSVTIHFQS